MTRGRAMLQWAERVFGSTALLRDERATRCLEEVMELAHVEGVGEEVVHRLARRVWSRPVGNTRSEFDQACSTLETYSALVGETIEEGAEREWRRVQTLDEDELRDRHRAKIQLGIASAREEELR